MISSSLKRPQPKISATICTPPYLVLAGKASDQSILLQGLYPGPSRFNFYCILGCDRGMHTGRLGSSWHTSQSGPSYWIFYPDFSGGSVWHIETVWKLGISASLNWRSLTNNSSTQSTNPPSFSQNLLATSSNRLVTFPKCKSAYQPVVSNSVQCFAPWGTSIAAVPCDAYSSSAWRAVYLHSVHACA